MRIDYSGEMDVDDSGDGDATMIMMQNCHNSSPHLQGKVSHPIP